MDFSSLNFSRKFLIFHGTARSHFKLETILSSNRKLPTYYDFLSGHFGIGWKRVKLTDKKLDLVVILIFVRYERLR